RPPRTVTSKLNVYIGATSSALLLLTVWVSYYTSANVLERQTNAEAVKQVRSLAEKMDDFVSKIAELPNGIAAHQQQSTGAETRKGMVSYLATVLNQTPIGEAQSVYIAYEKKNWQDKDAMIRVDRQSWPNPSHVSYDYTDPKWEWYIGAKSTGEPYLSEPYFDVGRSNINLISVSKPVYDERGALTGVAGADIPLEQMRTIVAHIQLRSEPTAGEYGFLLSRGGKLKFHPNEKLLLTGGDADEEVTNPEDGKFAASKPEGFAIVRMGGIARRVYWATASITGWKVALSVPEAYILLPL